MSFTLHLPPLLQLAISLPLITLIFADCLTTIAHMYTAASAQHSQFRDLFFIGAICMCIKIFIKTYATTLLIVNEKESKEEITILHMPVRRQAETNNAQTITPKKQEEVITAETTAQEETPAKAPTTPPPTKESKGPMQDKTMIY